MRGQGERSVLITGCSSGIGYTAAHTLAGRGWRVVAACRQEADCERLADEGLTTVRLDYEDIPSIAAAYESALEKTGGRLDALFNNGAYAIPGAVEDMPGDALRAIFQANLFGWHELTRLAVATMREQGYGRIVQNSSGAGAYGAEVPGRLRRHEVRAGGADRHPASGDGLLPLRK
jgi:NAD(P)-dependent dehydrogenase (short-subunit alcohol dehydrogenase family)